MVRVAGLLDQVVARVNVRSPDGRTPQQALAEVREGALELGAAQSRLWRDELVPALAAEGVLIGGVEDASDEELRELETRFARQIYPVLTPLAVGPGQPFPYISGLSLSLGVTVRDPDSGEERFARVKVPETLPRFVAIGERGLLIPLEGVISHYLSWVFPGMELTERAAFRVTRDGDTEISDDADDLLEAVESELRKRRFGAVVRLEVSSSISRAMVARLSERLVVRPDSVYPIHGLLDLRDVMQLYNLDRPDLKYEPWVPQTQRRLAKPTDGDLFAGDRRRGHRRPASVRLVRDERRGVRDGGGEGSRSRDAEDDRLPHEPRLGPRAGADRGGRERQAERLHRRAEGPVRRAPQHRVGPLARAGGRPRRLRLPGHEDPREDDARDPPRGRRPAALRPYRNRELPRDDRADLRGRRAVHRRSGDLGRHRRPVQLRHGLRPPAGVPQDPRRPVQPAARARRAHPRRRRGGRRRRARADPDQGEQHRRPGDRRGALQGLPGRRRDRPDRARRLRAPAGRPGALRAESASARSSAASSSTAVCTASRPARRGATCSGAPT